MLVSADWIVPVTRQPIKDGGVVVQGTRIVEIGDIETLSAAYPAESRTHFADSVITPGLVNAHTHLSLTALEGVIPPGQFHDWLAEIPAAVHALDATDIGNSSALGAIHCLLTGTTAVGDISYGPEAPAAAADAGLAGTYYWEVLGVPGSELEHVLREMDFPDDPRASNSPRMACGISPHAPYTSGPGLLRASHDFAKAHGSGFAIHIAESPAEVDLLKDGSGPLRRLADRLADGFVAPGTSPVRYLESLGVLEDAVTVHCVHVQGADVELLAEQSRGVVLCPRSNAYLHAGRAPVSALAAAGARIALGTDSTASNADLDLLEDARALAELAPEIRPERMLRIVTLEGAEVLGLSDVVGSLEAGKQADLAVWNLPGTSDPAARLIADGGRSSLRSVLSAGTWRVLDGQPAFPVRNLELAVESAKRKAVEALRRPRG